MRRGDRGDLLDDDLLEELLDLLVGPGVLGPGHQVAEAEPMQQVVGRLAAERHAELLAEEAPDVGAAPGTDPVLGRRPGLQACHEPWVLRAR